VYVDEVEVAEEEDEQEEKQALLCLQERFFFFTTKIFIRALGFAVHIGTMCSKQIRKCCSFFLKSFMLHGASSHKFILFHFCLKI